MPPRYRMVSMHGRLKHLWATHGSRQRSRHPTQLYRWWVTAYHRVDLTLTTIDAMLSTKTMTPFVYTPVGNQRSMLYDPIWGCYLFTRSRKQCHTGFLASCEKCIQSQMKLFLLT